MQKRWGEKRSRDKVEVETVGLRIMSPSEHLQRRSKRVLKVCAVAKNLMAETKDQGSGRIRWGKKKKKRLVGERVTSHQAKPCAAPSPHTTLSCKCWSVVMEVGGGEFILNTSRLDTFPDCANANATTASCMQPGRWIVKLENDMARSPPALCWAVHPASSSEMCGSQQPARRLCETKDPFFFFFFHPSCYTCHSRWQADRFSGKNRHCVLSPPSEQTCLPSAAKAHRTRSKSIPADSRQFGSIPAAPALHLVLEHLPSPPASVLRGGHPPGSPAPTTTLGWPVRRPLLRPGAISSGQVAEVSVVNNTLDRSSCVNGKHSGPAVSSCVQGWRVEGGFGWLVGWLGWGGRGVEGEIKKCALSLRCARSTHQHRVAQGGAHTLPKVWHVAAGG